MSDIISRQAAIDALEREKTYCHAFRDGYAREDVFKRYNMGLSDGIKAIERLPSAQPERKKGKWIHDGYDIPHGIDWMHCSVCGRREPHVPAAMTNFCPNCGAEMKGDNDD